MSWAFEAQQPREITSHGYDAVVWEWGLRDAQSGDTATALVFLSGTAMAVADDQLPFVVTEAKRTRGRSAVEPFLHWSVPPRRIELDTSTQRPRTHGGLQRANGDAHELRELTRWFSERGIDLELEQRDENWTALMLPQGVRVGSADYGVGKSALEAAADARRRFESSGFAADAVRRQI